MPNTVLDSVLDSVQDAGYSIGTALKKRLVGAAKSAAVAVIVLIWGPVLFVTSVMRALVETERMRKCI